MKISITNFKAIESLIDFELKDLNILAGINSCGKTSLIQFLMLIKQTIESREDENTLILNKPYIELGKFADIVNGRDLDKKISMKLRIFKEDIYIPNCLIGKSIQSLLKDKDQFQEFILETDFIYSKEGRKILLQQFKITIILKDNESIEIEKPEQSLYFLLALNNDKIYRVTYNSEIFLHYPFISYKEKKISFSEEFTEQTGIASVEFNNIYPRIIRYENSSSDLVILSRIFDHLYIHLRNYFSGISYIGPLREAPHTYYIDNDEVKLRIGNKGEYTAQILSQEAAEIVEYLRLPDRERISSSLLEAVNYWICKFFGLGKSIESKVQDQEKRVFKILLENENGLKVPITHVGFGVSQILPIVVEGLRMPSNGILILEQPEIHLHPKLQSLLMDFLICLADYGIKVLMETHSDHIITRLRRRVVEDLSDSLIKKVNLCFIEQGTGRKLFNQLQLNELGTFKKWPKDFFDQLQNEHQEIVLAQSRKRIKARGNQV